MKTTAFKPANILVPNNNADMEKWAVIACDQYTSEPEYWEETKAIVSESPSTLRLILPEVYLNDKDVSDRIKNIHSEMEKITKENFFDEYKDSMIYVERVQSNGIVRKGIVGKIDLEAYDYSKGSTSEVRATEATVIERIPPRVKIRQGALLELPHIMILIDDPDMNVIEPIGNKKNDLKNLYDFKLMQNGGSISGYLLNNSEIERVNNELLKLAEPQNFEKKYGLKDKSVLLYAMGDGNHSLATAKAYYEQLKKDNPDKDMSQSAARYALVEIVNLHSDALKFEAIHRFINETDADSLVKKMTQELGLSEENISDQCFELVTSKGVKKLYIKNKSSKLTVGSVQNFLDNYLKENDGKIDYIHGSDTLKKLVSECGEHGLGIILPDMDKADLFPTVILDGALPRKTFSMGHAEDKRYYIEARRIDG